MRVQTAFDFGPEPPEASSDSHGPDGLAAGLYAPGGSPARSEAHPAQLPLLDSSVEVATLSPEEADPFESGTRFTRVGLEMHLQVLCGRELTLHVTDNGRTMISTRNQRGRFVVRVHHMFLDAPTPVLAALGAYLTQSDAAAPRVLFDFIKSQHQRIRRTPRRAQPLRARGEHHDLQQIYEQLNRRYFAGGVRARITWGKHSAARKRARRSIKLGSYQSVDALIRIHPVLDAAWVPRFFVAFIVYHEMLHQVVAPTVHGTRREYHSPAFRARERQFDDYAEAIAWERVHLRRLLRS